MTRDPEHRREWARLYLKTHPEYAEKGRIRARERMQRVRATEPDQVKRRTLYAELVGRYGAVCCICGREPEPGRRLSIDHDHESGEIRGLLCRGCNYGIGCLKDSVALLEAAIAYLSRAQHTGISFGDVQPIQESKDGVG